MPFHFIALERRCAIIVREFLTRLNFSADDRKVKSFDQRVRQLRTALLAVVGAATAASAAAFKLANDSAKYGDELSKTARQLGFNVEGLEEYRFAAERSGIAQGTFNQSMQAFSKRMGEAAQGTGEARNALDALGLNIQEIKDLAPEEQLKIIADEMSGIENPAERAAIASDLFSRSGIAMTNMLGEGAEGIEKLLAESRRLGKGLTEEQGPAAEAFTDAITNMQTVMSRLRLQIGAKLMPVFQPMVEAFTEFLIVNREIIMERVQRTFEILIGVMRNLTDVAGRVFDAFQMIVGTFQALPDEAKIAAAAVIAAFAVRRFPIIAALTGLILLLEDIGAWMNDQPSVIGAAVGPFENFAEAMTSFGEKLSRLREKLRDLIGDDLADKIDAVMLALLGLLAVGGIRPFAATLGILASAVRGLAGAFGLLGAGTAAATGMAGLAKFLKVGALVAIPFLGGGANAGEQGDVDVNPKTGVPRGSIADRLITDDDRTFLQKLFDIQPTEEQDRELQERPGFKPDLPPSREEMTSPPQDQPKAAPKEPKINMQFEIPDLGDLDFGPVSSGPAFQPANVDNRRETTLNVEVTQNITVPPGTSSDQVAEIQRVVSTTLSREIDKAALATEA